MLSRTCGNFFKEPLHFKFNSSRINRAMSQSQLTVSPKSRGFAMPAEWESHEKTWMAWPYSRKVWRCLPDGTVPAHRAFIGIVNAIATFEPVFVGAREEDLQQVTDVFQQNENVSVVPLEYNDIWLRDIGPTFVINRATGERAGIDWTFNCWGEMGKAEGSDEGLPYDKDVTVAKQIIAKEGAIPIPVEFVMEGGALHVDGEGTVLAVEECVLNPNRNPMLTKPEIEQILLEFLGAEKVIWLPLGLYGDEDTNGHVDNFVCFSKPGHVLLAWTDDTTDPQYEISANALDLLSSATDARGRALQITKVHIPRPMFYQAEDCVGLESVSAGQETDSSSESNNILRSVGTRLAASYINFYIANGGVVIPAFGDAERDLEAFNTIQQAFPLHRVIQVPTRDIVLGGGNIHCITQQQCAV